MQASMAEKIATELTVSLIEGFYARGECEFTEDFAMRMPIIIVMIASALGLVIPASYVDSKVNVPIFSLLALVAMHWGVSSALPEVNYLVMIDVLYIIAYVAVTAMLAFAVAGSWALQSRGEQATVAMERRALIVISLAYVLATAAVFIVYLV